jgi:glucosamine--fructose-6-phosphate aminotransferase (isomerizing)
MDVKQQIRDIPRILTETFEKGRGEYEAVIRRTRWGEGPIYVCGCGPAATIGWTAVYAFEGLLGWPVVLREITGFQNYSLAVLRPRSVVLLISSSGDSSQALELARVVHSRGASLLLMTSDVTSPLAQAADGVFLVPASESPDGPMTTIVQHAVLTFIAMLAAQVFKRPSPQWDSVESEFAKLPGQVEWALSQFPDALRSLASELLSLPELWVVGGGFYHAPALRAGCRLKGFSGLHAQGMEVGEFATGPLASVNGTEAVLLLTSSRSRIRKEVHQIATQARIKGAKILSLTDSGDRELAERSLLAILLPTLTEIVGSTLTLTLLEWLAVEVAGEARKQGKISSLYSSMRTPNKPGGSK